MVWECYSGRERSRIAKENWKPMDPREFGYEVSVRPNAHRPYRLWGSGEGTYKAAWLGKEYTFAIATFFSPGNAFRQPAFFLAGNRVAVVPLKKKERFSLYVIVYSCIIFLSGYKMTHTWWDHWFVMHATLWHSQMFLLFRLRGRHGLQAPKVL